jgi:hypothetical protein
MPRKKTPVKYLPDKSTPVKLAPAGSPAAPTFDYVVYLFPFPEGQPYAWYRWLTTELPAVLELERCVNALFGMKLSCEALEEARVLLSERLRLSFRDVGYLPIEIAVRELRAILDAERQQSTAGLACVAPLAVNEATTPKDEIGELILRMYTDNHALKEIAMRINEREGESGWNADRVGKKLTSHCKRNHLARPYKQLRVRKS